MSPPIDQETIPTINKEYNQVLGALIEGGLEYSEASKQAQKEVLNKHEELDFYLGGYSSPDQIRIRKTITLEILEGIQGVKDLGGWDKLDLDAKNDILHELGCAVDKTGWWEQVGYIKKGNMTVIDKYILSEERMDERWIGMLVDGVSVASEGAIEASWVKRHSNYDILKDRGE